MKRHIKVVSFVLAFFIFLGTFPNSFSYGQGVSPIDLIKQEWEQGIKENGNFKIGDYLYIGTYLGDPILWRVIDFASDGSALLLSHYVIEDMQFSTNVTDFSKGYLNNQYITDKVEWSFSDLRSWLNSRSGFLSGDNFNEFESSIILEKAQKEVLTGYRPSLIEGGSLAHASTYSASKNSFEDLLLEYDNSYYRYTTDKVFLLDIRQTTKLYLSDLDQYVEKDGAVVESMSLPYFRGIPTDYVRAKMKDRENKFLPVYSNWLRNVWGPKGSTTGIGALALDHRDGQAVNTISHSSWNGVRPAIYVNPDTNIKYGDGSFYFPYELGNQADFNIEDIFTILNIIEELLNEDLFSKTYLRALNLQLERLNNEIMNGSKFNDDRIVEIMNRTNNFLIRIPSRIIEVPLLSYSIGEIKEFVKDEAKIEDPNNNSIVLKDIDNHWGKKYIDILVTRAGIKGYDDGTFRPDNFITKAEFLTMVMQSIGANITPKGAGEHWATGVFKDAIRYGVITQDDFPKEEWDKQINRYEMTYIMINSTEKLLRENSVDTSKVDKIMGDYDKVIQEDKYNYYVMQAFMKGLVGGKSADGIFDGTANGTRAESATMVVRMLIDSSRIKVDLE